MALVSVVEIFRKTNSNNHATPSRFKAAAAADNSSVSETSDDDDPSRASRSDGGGGIDSFVGEEDQDLDDFVSDGLFSDDLLDIRRSTTRDERQIESERREG